MKVYGIPKAALWDEIHVALKCFTQKLGWSLEYHLPSDFSVAVFADDLLDNLERQAGMEGMLWYDNDATHSLAQKIKQAAAHYEVKFGRRATVCWVSEQEFDEQTQVSGIYLRGVNYIQPNHVVVGVGEERRGETMN
jgi:hypothetical protein